jgi:hypothetical protein
MSIPVLMERSEEEAHSSLLRLLIDWSAQAKICNDWMRNFFKPHFTNEIRF